METVNNREFVRRSYMRSRSTHTLAINEVNPLTSLHVLPTNIGLWCGYNCASDVGKPVGNQRSMVYFRFFNP